MDEPQDDYEIQQCRDDTQVHITSRIHEMNDHINEKGGCYEHPDRKD